MSSTVDISISSLPSSSNTMTYAIDRKPNLQQPTKVLCNFIKFSGCIWDKFTTINACRTYDLALALTTGDNISMNMKPFGTLNFLSCLNQSRDLSVFNMSFGYKIHKILSYKNYQTRLKRYSPK